MNELSGYNFDVGCRRIFIQIILEEDGVKLTGLGDFGIDLLIVNEKSLFTGLMYICLEVLELDDL